MKSLATLSILFVYALICLNSNSVKPQILTFRKNICFQIKISENTHTHTENFIEIITYLPIIVILCPMYITSCIKSILMGVGGMCQEMNDEEEK